MSAQLLNFFKRLLSVRNTLEDPGAPWRQAYESDILKDKITIEDLKKEYSFILPYLLTLNLSPTIISGPKKKQY